MKVTIEDEETARMLAAFSGNDHPWAIFERTEEEIAELLLIMDLANNGEFDLMYVDICREAIKPFIYRELKAIDDLDISFYRKNVMKNSVSHKFLRKIVLNLKDHIPELNEIISALKVNNIEFRFADFAYASIDDISSGVEFACDVKRIMSKASAQKPVFLLINLIEHNINRSFPSTPANKEVVIKFDGTQSPNKVFQSITKTLLVACEPHFKSRSCYFEGIAGTKSLDPGDLEYWKSDTTRTWYADAQNECLQRFTIDEPEFDECVNQWSRELVQSLKDDLGVKFYVMTWGS